MWRLDDFELGPCIGSGAFGRLLLVRERCSGAVAVLKAMKKRRIERLRVRRHVAHEIKIQGHLRHPNILRLFGFFWDSTRIYTILEHAAGGDLDSLMRAQPGQHFGEESVAHYIKQAASAIEYCHRVHVIHRDLKPQNVLLARKGRVKLADFGWAVHTFPDQRRWTLCGTLDYLAPEIVHAANGHSFGVDVWGLGVLAYELLVGQPPFASPAQEETYRRILEATPTFPDGLSGGARDLVGRLLQRDPEERLPPGEVVVHPWVRHNEGGAGEGRIAAFAGA